MSKRFGLLAALAALAIWPGVSDSRPPGGTPISGCGVVCAPVAALSIEVPSSYFGLVERQGFLIDYSITNTTYREVTGLVNILYNAKEVSDNKNTTSITLQPGEKYQGTVSIANPVAGNSNITITLFSPLSCTAVRKCNGFKTLAADTEDFTVAPDRDYDGIPDPLEATLLATYSPLLLFSKDHGSQEKYAPIDVIDFIKQSALISKDVTLPGLPNTFLAQTSLSAQYLIMNSDGAQGGQLTGAQNPANLPRALYVAPSNAAQKGATWPSVLANKHTGMYGHVVLIPVSEITDDDLRNELAGNFCSDYGDRPCDRAIFKVEYWQFFGYSHDFEVPKSAYVLQTFVDALLPGAVPLPISELAADVIDHSGDWCTVQLYVDPSLFPGEKSVLAVYHYAHGLQFKFDLNQPFAAGPIPSGTSYSPSSYDIKQFQGNNAGKEVSLPFQGGAKTQAYLNAQNNTLQMARQNASGAYVHPVVYVEWGGHEFWPTSAWSLEFASKHSGDGYGYFATNVPNLGEIGNPMPDVPAAGLVVGFAGYWGYYGWENRNKPPQGPPLHRQWHWYGSVPNVRNLDAPF